jgi:glycosyltransferase involved in cell wall biosynthesis
VHVSVIIPSFLGAHKLPNVLEALARQTYTDFEVIVVLDGSADHSLEVLSSLKPLLALNVQDFPNQSRSITRNRGAKAAKGDLLIFFDDDMRPVPGCVAAHVKQHQIYKDSVCGGAQLEEIAAMQSDFQHYKAYLSRKWTQPLYQCQEPLSRDRLFLTAANFSIPARLFRQLVGFDERLTDAEDFDLAVRAYLQKIPIFFNAQALAWHDDFVTPRSYTKRLRQYKEAHAALYQLKPEIYREFNQYEYRPVKGVKKLLYMIAANPLIIRLFESEKFKSLPRNLRFKLYDIVTTSLAVHFPDRVL